MRTLCRSGLASWCLQTTHRSWPLMSLRCAAHRRRALQERDPVVVQKLSVVLKERIGACAALHGPAFEAAAQRLPPALAEQLRAAMGMGSGVA